MIVMIDTCVVLDYLLDREPFVYDAEKLLVKVAEEEIQGLITVKSLMDIHYILKHTLHKEEKVRDTITTLLDSLMLVDSTAEDAIRALSSRITDYEDAIKTVISYGGDTDTNACIVGSMAEVLHGVPEHLVVKARKKLPDCFNILLDEAYERDNKRIK